MEVLVVALMGAGLAWLQAHNAEPDELTIPVDDEWTRWEAEIHDWKDH